MKYRFIFTAMSAVVLASAAVSCSDMNEDMPIPDAGGDNAIRFAANTEYSRVSDITTNNLTSFQVYAYTGSSSAPNLFMDNVTVSKSGSSVWTYSPVQYWPAKETVDFYAFAPASWVGSDGPLMPVPYDALTGVEDIVYAVSPDLSGNNGQPNAQVFFNFRHALSKLTVKLSSTDTRLKVVVTNVAINRLMSKGNFHFPTASTTGTPTEESVGVWTDQNTPSTYMLHWSQSMTDQLTLTTTPTVVVATGLGRGGEMFVMPQTLTYSSGSEQDNYIGVQCSIYDVASGEKLWPNANTPAEDLVEHSSTGDGMLKFPLSSSRFSAWQPGCHYIYSLVINSNEEMGAIEFGTPSVDTFIGIETNYQ
ncbi:MAG: fimbrillin family protein [Muribaculaceae bacterium]|nr:fimbrillin family protein [Muribaculaceae bacterium]